MRHGLGSRSQQVFERGHQAGGNLFDVPNGVNDAETLEVGLGKFGKASRDKPIIVIALAAHAVSGCTRSLSRARFAFLYGDFQQERPVGQQAPASDSVERHDVSIAHAPCPALIRAGRIDEAVAQDPVATIKRWFNELGDMIRAGCGEEQSFSSSIPAVFAAGHQERSDIFRAPCSAGFSCRDDGLAEGTKRVGNALDLSGLANTLPAFKGDEGAAQRQKKDIKPAQARPKKPATGTSFSATSGVICGGIPLIVTMRSAIC